MKSFNLASLIQSKRGLEREVFDSVLKYLKIGIKEVELECLDALYDKLSSVVDLNNFFMGYVIPQIGKEFDLLRFGKESLINIELKSESDREAITKQLKQNRYYLSFIDKQLHLFSYWVSENKLFKLVAGNKIEEVQFEHLIELLESQELEEQVDLDSMFIPSNYLVSPFNSTEKFMVDNYFLTDNQENIKKSILKTLDSTGAVITAISGEPGTGKTLLTYDIAKDLRKRKSVAIIHCAYLNNGQIRLIYEHGWDIFSVRNWSSITLSNYDVIIIDEAQRMYTDQLEELHKSILDNGIKCIFAYDGKQCFSDEEFRRKNPEKIEKDFKAKKFELTKTIRTNKEIVRFVSNLFDPRQGKLGSSYESVDFLYFEEVSDVKIFIEKLRKKDWQIINYTSSRIYIVSYDRYQDDANPNAHHIIGQEFDKVVAIIDSNFFFDQYGYLSSRRVSGAPNYNMDKMLYQIMTRAREKLMIIILNNESVLKKCIKIVEAQ